MRNHVQFTVFVVVVDVIVILLACCSTKQKKDIQLTRFYSNENFVMSLC